MQTESIKTQFILCTTAGKFKTRTQFSSEYIAHKAARKLNLNKLDSVILSKKVTHIIHNSNTDFIAITSQKPLIQYKRYDTNN